MTSSGHEGRLELAASMCQKTASSQFTVPVTSKLGRLGHGFLRRMRGMPRQGVELRVPIVKLGSDYGGYFVCPDGLSSSSVVYSFGIGEDISFDLGVIERFGARVHAFDPTPRSIAWVRAQAVPSALVLHEFGLADYDGVASFSPPVNPEHISHTMLDRSQASGPAIEVPVRRLASVLASLGHDRVDILKMDIEGAEYGVIDDLVTSRIAVSQLLVEFHHHLAGVPLSKTEAAIETLRGAGFGVFHVSDTGREFSLLRR